MQKSLRALGALIVLAIGILCWRLFFPSPESLIRSQLARLAKAATYNPNTNPVMKAYKAEQVPDYFTPDVVIHMDVRGFERITLTGREEILEAEKAAMVSDWAHGLIVEFRDISVALAADKQTATVNLTLKVSVDGQPDFIIQEVNLGLRKVGRHWLIDQVDSVRTLSAVNGSPAA